MTLEELRLEISPNKADSWSSSLLPASRVAAGSSGSFFSGFPWWNSEEASCSSSFNKRVCRRIVGVHAEISSLAGRGGDGEVGFGMLAAGDLRLGLSRQSGAGLLWRGLLVVGWRLRSSLWLWLEAASSWRWWLGEVSPPMLGHRLRFRRLRRMSTAVLQRSMFAIEPQLLFGLRMVRFFLRWRLDGVGVRQRAERWCSLKTSRCFFAISCLYRGLFALCHG